MRIRYSPPSEIDPEGTPVEFRVLWKDLMDALNSGSVELTLDTETTFNPSPYQTALVRLYIHSVTGRIQVSVSEEGELTIAGPGDGLAAFAACLVTPDDVKDGYHRHFEYWDGHAFIAPDSLPLVISVRRPLTPQTSINGV